MVMMNRSQIPFQSGANIEMSQGVNKTDYRKRAISEIPELSELPDQGKGTESDVGNGFAQNGRQFGSPEKPDIGTGAAGAKKIFGTTAQPPSKDVDPVEATISDQRLEQRRFSTSCTGNYVGGWIAGKQKRTGKRSRVRQDCRFGQEVLSPHGSRPRQWRWSGRCHID